MKFMELVIIPTFNSSKFLDETINSVINQTYKNWELIIVDDNSEDNTLELINKVIINEPRIKLIIRNRKPKGAPTCRNLGVKNSNGNYIIFLDSDDILAPWCLDSRMKYFNENQNFHFLVFQTLIFKHTILDSKILWNKLKGQNDLSRFSKSDNVWQTAGVIWKRNALTKLEKWDEELKCWQDWEFHLRAIIIGLNYRKIDVIPDNYYRKSYDLNENSISNQKNYINYWDNAACAIIKISNISSKNVKINLASIIFKHSMLLIADNHAIHGFKYIYNLVYISCSAFILCFIHLLMKYIIMKITGVNTKLYKSRLLLPKKFIETKSTYLKLKLNDRDFNELKTKFINH